MGLFGWLKKQDSDDDDEDVVYECLRCGGRAVNWAYCSDACSEEHWWEQEERNRGRSIHNTDPNCPVCSGAGSCQLCEDRAE